MKLSTFKHTPQEKKRYTVAYSDWLDDGEVISSVSFGIDNTTDPVLLIESSAIAVDGLGVTFFVSGGLDEEEYLIAILAETDAGQRKEDYMKIVVADVV